VTATREDALAVPIQALTVRSESEMRGAEAPAGRAAAAGTASAASDPAAAAPTPAAPAAPDPAAAPTAAAPATPGNKELEGVFVLDQGQALFRPVRLGITGELHVEVLHGLEGGEKVVVGPYETLRGLKDGDQARERGQGEPGQRRP
jgi:HlyD family secretion protein